MKYSDRTWSGNSAYLDIGEAKYSIVHYGVQRDVDCKCDEGEKSGDEGEE